MSLLHSIELFNVHLKLPMNVRGSSQWRNNDRYNFNQTKVRLLKDNYFHIAALSHWKYSHLRGIIFSPHHTISVFLLLVAFYRKQNAESPSMQGSANRKYKIICILHLNVFHLSLSKYVSGRVNKLPQTEVLFKSEIYYVI